MRRVATDHPAMRCVATDRAGERRVANDRAAERRVATDRAAERRAQRLALPGAAKRRVNQSSSRRFSWASVSLDAPGRLLLR